VERTSWGRLTPDERKELEAALRDPGRFLSDYGDSAAWWLLVLLAGLGGAVASGMELWEYARTAFPLGLIPLAFLASVAGIVWSSVTWALNHNRRGFAATSFATFRVKGHRLLLVRHRDVARIEWTRHAPPRKQRFSVLRLTGTDGKDLTLYAHGGWVRAAIAHLDQARAAAGLPPIQGDARRLPE
jgi:hypothetical protein